LKLGSASASILGSAFGRDFPHRHVIHWSSSFIVNPGTTDNLLLWDPRKITGAQEEVATMMTFTCWAVVQFCGEESIFSSPSNFLVLFH